MGALLHRIAAMALGLAALAVVPAPAGAQEACPGATGACPYTSVTQTGSRGGGVLRFPQAVAVGPDGAIYVGDQGSHLIQQFAPNGTWLRDIGASGTRPGELTAVASLSVAGDGTLLAADGGTNRVVRFDTTGGLIDAWRPGPDLGPFHFGAGGGHDAPAGGGLTVAGSAVYVADTANDRVLRFDLDGGRGVQIIAPGQLQNPRGLAVRNTRLLVADDQNHRLAVFDTGGRFLSSVGLGNGAGPGQLNFPYDVDLDPQGRVFVADDLNHRVVRFSTSATGYRYKARWGSYGTAPGRLAFPRGIATDAHGNVYVTNTGNDRIDVFDNGGALLRSFGISGRGTGQFDAPLGVAADAGGLRAVADAVNGRVQLLNPDGTVATIWGSPNPGPTILPSPVAVAFDAAGNGFVLDGRRSRIVVFDRATATTSATIGVEGSGPGQLLAPAALAIAGDGTIAVADAGNSRIARFAADGGYLGSIPTGAPPRGIAVTPDGSRIFITDTRNRISVYNPAGALLDQFGGTGRALGKLNVPGQLTLDAAGTLWVADRGNHRVQHFGPRGERLGAFGVRGTGPGEFIRPTGVALDCTGRLTVTDSDNNRVQTFQLAAPANVACAPLPAPAPPPALQYPTLPAPEGPVLDVRVLRTSGLLTARSLPLSIGCDTTCKLTVSATVTQRPSLKPQKNGAKPRRPVVVTLRVPAQTIAAGASKVVRLTLTRAQAMRLRKALGRKRGLQVTVEIQAAAVVGQPTSQTERIAATS